MDWSGPRLLFSTCQHAIRISRGGAGGVRSHALRISLLDRECLCVAYEPNEPGPEKQMSCPKETSHVVPKERQDEERESVLKRRRPCCSTLEQRRATPLEQEVDEIIEMGQTLGANRPWVGLVGGGVSESASRRRHGWSSLAVRRRQSGHISRERATDNPQLDSIAGGGPPNGKMGLWPFGRRKSRRASRGGAVLPRSDEGIMHDAGRLPDSSRHNQDEIVSSGPERRASRRDRKRRSSRESKKLKRNPDRQRTYSFSPGRNDDIMIIRDANPPPVPPLPANLKGKAARASTVKQDTPAYAQQPIRASTQPVQNSYEWQRIPTLHKRSAQELAHRKSSKRRKEEHDREKEIKAMAAFMPTRPSAEPNSSGRLMKRESKKIRAGLNRDLQNPSSDISLPTTESMHSSLSAESEPKTSYRLSAFDMLAPRPTIKYAENPRYAPGASGFGSDRSDSRRRLTERKTLDEEILKANKRIDELADDLNAGELRELMERDQKRREKKQAAERIKMERRLARRQEQQNVEDAAAIRDGTPPPVNMDRGVMGREVVGLGIGTSAVVSNKRKSSSESDNGRGKRPTEPFREDSLPPVPRPSNSQRTNSLATENLTAGSERSESVIDVTQVRTVAKANVSPPPSPRAHLRGASSISQMMELTNKPEPMSFVAAALKPESSRKSSENSSDRRGPPSWTSFFKRNKTKRESAPSSFSNASRDSMQNISFSQAAYTQRPSSTVPKRTMSKFREDLPEFPISPPDSRVQSPEADVVPPIRDYPEKRSALQASDDPRVRYDTPNSGYRSLDVMRLQDETPTSGHRSAEVPSNPSPEPTAVLSQSLASIDSEGSWLSGRKAGSKRGSAQLAPLHGSANSLQKRFREYSESAEELGIAEDEYFSRLTPGPEEEFKIHRQSTGNPMPSSDEEDGGSLASPVPSEKTKWGAVGRQPTVVHREPRAKSREGLLNEFEDDSSSITAGDSPVEPKRKSYRLSRDIIDENSTGVQRATSVEYRSGHVRQISTGSVRLLDLKPRSSEQARRMSSG
ncbi:hypothetical protein BJ875DRAFT_439462 [Amylocarpus encephaloides]|uniref:Uncharacterized protein n=1 Tax=Amylocarpus encephaloides TaxID=45428 RepID=A0A9P7YMK0_9HELO|nr:hypothetical protein BJ875DRAFT_439462 [Amylocarpus encephaloides]